MFLIKALAHVCIRTTDLEKTMKFYCGALGIEKLFDFTREGKVIGCYIQASPHAFIEIFLIDELAKGSKNQNLHHFCLETGNIAQARELLLEYSPGEIKTGADHSLQFWVKDPSGVDVEFHQYTERSAQLTGQNVEVDW